MEPATAEQTELCTRNMQVDGGSIDSRHQHHGWTPVEGASKCMDLSTRVSSPVSVVINLQGP